MLFSIVPPQGKIKQEMNHFWDIDWRIIFQKMYKILNKIHLRIGHEKWLFYSTLKQGIHYEVWKDRLIPKIEASHLDLKTNPKTISKIKFP